MCVVCVSQNCLHNLVNISDLIYLPGKLATSWLYTFLCTISFTRFSFSFQFPFLLIPSNVGGWFVINNAICIFKTTARNKFCLYVHKTVALYPNFLNDGHTCGIYTMRYSLLQYHRRPKESIIPFTPKKCYTSPVIYYFQTSLYLKMTSPPAGGRVNSLSKEKRKNKEDM